jgi:hypothetical protein
MGFAAVPLERVSRFRTAVRDDDALALRRARNTLGLEVILGAP